MEWKRLAMYNVHQCEVIHIALFGIFINGLYSMVPIRYIFMSPIPKNRWNWPRARLARISFQKNHGTLKIIIFFWIFVNSFLLLQRTIAKNWANWILAWSKETTNFIFTSYSFLACNKPKEDTIPLAQQIFK